jgi:hypothetical protein
MVGAMARGRSWREPSCCPPVPVSVVSLLSERVCIQGTRCPHGCTALGHGTTGGITTSPEISEDTVATHTARGPRATGRSLWERRAPQGAFRFSGSSGIRGLSEGPYIDRLLYPVHATRIQRHVQIRMMHGKFPSCIASLSAHGCLPEHSRSQSRRASSRKCQDLRQGRNLCGGPADNERGLTNAQLAKARRVWTVGAQST